MVLGGTAIAYNHATPTPGMVRDRTKEIYPVTEVEDGCIA